LPAWPGMLHGRRFSNAESEALRHAGNGTDATTAVSRKRPRCGGVEIRAWKGASGPRRSGAARPAAGGTSSGRRPGGPPRRGGWVGTAVVFLDSLDGLVDAHLGDARNGEPRVPVGGILDALDEVRAQVDSELIAFERPQRCCGDGWLARRAGLGLELGGRLVA